MRRDGASIKQIAAAVGAAKSSVSLWVRDIALTADQRVVLDDRVRANGGSTVAHAARSRHARHARERVQEDGRARARDGSPLHLAGCMLYWGEGSKSRNSVILTNSDADMLAFFLRFLRACYAVADDGVALSVNVFLGNGMTLDEIETWWLDRLQLPGACLRKATVNRASKASKGLRPQLLYGTARLAVSSTFIVQSIYGAIQEYVGCERPEWLDLGVKLPAPCLKTAS
jgi:hypothetical protein